MMRSRRKSVKARSLTVGCRRDRRCHAQEAACGIPPPSRSGDAGPGHSGCVASGNEWRSSPTGRSHRRSLQRKGTALACAVGGWGHAARCRIGPIAPKPRRNAAISRAASGGSAIALARDGMIVTMPSSMPIQKGSGAGGLTLRRARSPVFPPSGIFRPQRGRAAFRRGQGIARMAPVLVLQEAQPSALQACGFISRTAAAASSRAGHGARWWGGGRAARTGARDGDGRRRGGSPAREPLETARAGRRPAPGLPHVACPPGKDGHLRPRIRAWCGGWT